MEQNVANESIAPDQNLASNLPPPPATMEIPGRTDVRLRLVKPGDAEELYEVIDLNREHLQEFQQWAATATLESTEDAVTRSVESIETGWGLQYWIVEPGHENEEKIIGSVRYREYDPQTKSANIGYWVIKDAEGRGIVTAAAEQFIEYVFNNRDVDRIQFQINPSNIRSQKLASKLGAHDTGKIGTYEMNGKIYSDPLWEIVKP